MFFKYNYLVVLIKTIWFNLYYLPIRQSFRFPVIIADNVKFKRLKRGDFVIESPELYFGMSRIGFHRVPTVDHYSSHTIVSVENNGKIIIARDIHIGQGAKIYSYGGVIVCGKNFAISGDTSIISYKRIVFGDDVQLSWGSLIMDSDTHKIFDYDNKHCNEDKEITIGNKIWIGCNTTILKGAVVPNNSIVGANSVLTREYMEPHSLIVGSPAKIVKKVRDFEI